MRSEILNYNNYVKKYKLNIIFSSDEISFLWKKIFFQIMTYFFHFFFLFNKKIPNRNHMTKICSAVQTDRRKNESIVGKGLWFVNRAIV